MTWYWPFGKGSSTLFETYSLNDQSLIEGISDDTILLVLFTISLICLWAYYSQRERNTTIHPDNRQDIATLRERAQHDAQTNPTNEMPRFVGRPRHDTCPICLSESSEYSVETNCGHLFCGRCIITFWKYQMNWMNGMNCPVCRQPVTVLLTCFTADEEAAINNNAREAVTNDVKEFNRRFSGAQRTFREYISDIPVLIPHIFRQMLTYQNLTWTYRLRIIVIALMVIGYILSPFDILPESVLGFLGLFDDLLIIFCAALYVIILYREYLSYG